MIGTVAWLALGATAVVWQVVCRVSGGRYQGLGAVTSGLGRRWPGWIALAGIWAYGGWHLFARYTVPR